ncbi:MAG: hypothetical protein H0T62_04645 [Parachlamydiaceae bacterium]|nr:hypothetical protein [Parachlamydiaceae bacterium]
MLKKLLFIAAALFCTAESYAETIDAQFPTEFTVNQHWFSWTNDYTICGMVQNRQKMGNK